MNSLQFGLRLLRKSPGSTITIVGLLSLGIGASTVIFSVFDRVLLRPLPVRGPERLVRIIQNVPKLGVTSSFSYAYYEALRDHATTLESVFGEYGEFSHFALTEPQPAEQVTARIVTPGYFEALGIEPLYGRVLTAADEKSPDTPPAVLSYGFWQRHFQGDPQALGRTIVIQSHAFVVVGIMPRGVNGITVDTAPDVRVPFRALPLLTTITPTNLSYAAVFEIAGRLKPGVTRTQAQAECLALWKSAVGDMAKPAAFVSQLSRGVELEPLERGVSILRQRFGAPLKAAMALVGLLSLLVTVNSAGLLLAKAQSRRQEIGVRLAVGASRVQLVRQMLAESLPLAVAGAAGGLALALAAMPAAIRVLPPIRDRAASLLPISLDASLDPRVLAFSLGISLLALLLFGLAPALTASRTSIDTILRGAHSTGAGRGRRFLVITQIALCAFLLFGAGLLVRTFENLRHTDAGFERERIATFTLDLSGHPYTMETGAAFERALIARTNEIPGVISAAVAERGVLRQRGISATIGPEGRLIAPSDFLNANVNQVSPEYLKTMGIRLLAGRELAEADMAYKGQRNVVVSRAFADRFFPNTMPLGKCFDIGTPGSVAGDGNRIVGVVADAKYRSMREPMSPLFYSAGFPRPSFVLNVRTRVPPAALFHPVRKILTSLDPTLVFSEVGSIDKEIQASVSSERLLAVLVSVFGALAALIGAAGLYGLLAYEVEQRRREIGIRMALGAKPVHIAALTVRQTLIVVSIGLAVGLTGAVAAASAIRSLLYGVASHDGSSIAGAAVLVLLIASIATIVPTARAIQTRPAVALRQEN